MSFETSCSACFSKIPTKEQGYPMQNGKYLCKNCIQDPKFLCPECKILKSLDTESGIITDNMTLCKECLKRFAMFYLKRYFENEDKEKPRVRNLDELFWKK